MIQDTSNTPLLTVWLTPTFQPGTWEISSCLWAIQFQFHNKNLAVVIAQTAAHGNFSDKQYYSRMLCKAATIPSFIQSLSTLVDYEW